jgi:hypothetical protein
MRCFNHPDRQSIAICKSCGKGLCHDCFHESEAGISCRLENCKYSLSERKEFYTKQAAHLRNLKRLNFLGSFFSIGMGILFIYFSSRGYGLVYDFIFLMGIGFIVYGVVAQIVNMIIFFNTRRHRKK